MPTIVFSANTGLGHVDELEDIALRKFTSGNQLSATATTIGNESPGSDDRGTLLLRISDAGLAEIPAGSTIDSVQIELYSTYGLDGTKTIKFFRSLRAWGQTTATYTTYDGSNAWGSDGSRGAGTDYDATESLSASWATSGVGWRTFSGAGLVADLQAMLDGDEPNNGWCPLFLLTGTSDDVRTGRGTDGQRPIIVVEYTAGGGPDYTVEAESGAYTYTGGEATLAASRRLDAQGGTFSYSGGDADLTVSRLLDAQGGIYAYTGGDAGLIASRALSADGGTFAYAGGDASLLLSRVLSADGGIYTYTGGDASFTVAGVFQLAAEGGTFAYTGGDVTLTVSRRLSADGAAYNYSGGDAGLYARRALSAQGGSYTYAGGDADLVYNPGVFTLVAEGGTYTFTGGDAALIYSGAVRIRPWPGELVMRPAYSWGDDLTLQRQYPPIPLNLS